MGSGGRKQSQWLSVICPVQGTSEYIPQRCFLLDLRKHCQALWPYERGIALKTVRENTFDHIFEGFIIKNHSKVSSKSRSPRAS